MTNDREAIISAIKKDCSLMSSYNELTNDRELVLTALRHTEKHRKANEIVSEDFKLDTSFILECFNILDVIGMFAREHQLGNIFQRNKIASMTSKILKHEKSYI